MKCIAEIDGYTDFIFINRFGGVQHQGTMNKAIRRIIRDCNEKNPVLLPPFSCHSLCHTFTARKVESGVNVKVVQDVLGHKDVSPTLDIYTDVTKELPRREFEDLDEKLMKNMDSVDREQGNNGNIQNACEKLSATYGVLAEAIVQTAPLFYGAISGKRGTISISLLQNWIQYCPPYLSR